MSTAPQGWQTPKTNWQAADIVHPSDFNRIEGNIQAIESGSRTLDPSQVPSGNSGSLRQILSWFANRLKAITGAANWYDAPATTLAAAKSHIDATSGIHGATSSATANRIVIRDSAGRAQFANPIAAQDAATKGYVDASLQSYNSDRSAVVAIDVPATTINSLDDAVPIYQTEQIDRLNEYNPATGEFTAKQSGWYLATATLKIEIAPNSYTTVLFRSGSLSFADVVIQNPLASMQWRVVNLADIIQLNAGQRLYVMVVNGSRNNSIVVGEPGNRLAIFRIG